RVYELGNEWYFEFFSKRFDVHLNPADAKGVLFDTNESYDIPGKMPWVQRMITDKRVSAYGDVKGVVDYLNRNDTVFYYQKGFGVIAVAKIIGISVKECKGDLDERYWDVQFLTRTPSKFKPPYKALSVAEIRAATGSNF